MEYTMVPLRNTILQSEGGQYFWGTGVSGRASHLSEMDQVRLVSHQYDGGVDGAPHVVDQLLEVASLLETAAVRDGVWDDETLTRSHVLITHGCELCLVSNKEIFFTNSLSCILVCIMQNYGIYQIYMVMIWAVRAGR